VTLRAHFGGQEHEWQGRIMRIEGEVDARSRMVHAVARVEDPYGRSAGQNRVPLAVGMFVEAEIMGQVREDLFVIPRSAVREDGRVLMVDPEQKLRFRPVSIARVAGDSAYVQSGLADGELLCISPLAVATDGMSVRVFERAPNVGPDSQQVASP
jgi:multidrug efflux pump subunit AcrA (membrane-fusion protein)